MDGDYILTGILMSALIGCVIYGGYGCRKPECVTREKQQIQTVDTQKLSGDTYVIQTDSDVTWCVKENNTMKLVTRPKDCVKVIEDSENKVHKFKGKRHCKMFGFIDIRDDVDVFEVHTNKPMAYQTTKPKETHETKATGKIVEEQIEFSK